MKKSLITFLISGVLSSSLYASCSSTGCNNKITKLFVAANGRIFVGTDGNEKKLNCAGGSGHGGVNGAYLSINSTNKGANAIYTLLLTAKSLNKKVYLRVKTQSSYCDIVYASLDN